MNMRVTFIRQLAALLLGGSAIGAHAQHLEGLTGSVPVPTELAGDHGQLVTLARSPLHEAVTGIWLQVGGNAYLYEAELSEAGGYLVWQVILGDENFLLDAGNGKILAVSPVSRFRGERLARADCEVPMLNAVATAERAVGAGGAHSVKFDVEEGRPVWAVKVGVREVVVDAISGDIVRNEVRR